MFLVWFGPNECFKMDMELHMENNDKIRIITTCPIWCLRVTVNILNNYEIYGPNVKNKKN